ncbi:MAG: hypothetical protein R3F50_07240 [Gammaproteobacteria bacterium]|jgi:hypothetical protein
MKKVSAVLVALSGISSLSGQPAHIEVSQLFGECFPQFASNSDVLELYLLPDLEAEGIQVPYRENWLIPYTELAGLTRVIETGEVRATSPETLHQCNVQSATEVTLRVGETADYLYCLGAGYAKVAVHDLECNMFIDDDEILSSPDIQAWIRVLWADGTSPGWLLLDGSQTKSVGVLC